MTASRTQTEIVTRLEVKRNDMFPFAAEVLVGYLDYDHAKPYLKDGTTEENWAEVSDDDPQTDLIDYLEFAWGKANDERGISAERSVIKITEWLWLMGPAFEGLFNEFRDAPYPQYGKPKLAVVTTALAPELLATVVGS